LGDLADQLPGVCHNNDLHFDYGGIYFHERRHDERTSLATTVHGLKSVVSCGVLHYVRDRVRLDDRRLEVVKFCEASFDVAGDFESLPSCFSGLQVLDSVLVLYISHTVINERLFLLLLLRVDG